jgi:TetR/AcrR family transcriptional regulator, transcriptional repressor for nem operon
MKAALYARISTNEQRKESIDDQPGFSGDTPRLSVEARSQFALGLDDLISILAGLIAEAPSNPGKPDRRTLREQAISLCSQMVGALVLSRAVAKR